MNFFFYGTLMDTPLLSAVIGREVSKEELSKGVVQGFQKYTTDTNPEFVVIQLSEISTTSGVLIKNISEEEAKKLDNWEYDLYEKVLVQVDLENGDSIEAYTYADTQSITPTKKEGWSLDTFLKSKDYEKQLKEAHSIG